MNLRLTPMAVAIFSLYTLPATAQSAADTPQPSSTEIAHSQPQALPEVLVEGSSADVYKVERASSAKFTAPLRDTPRSMTVISAQLLQDTASTTLQDALRTVPGISFMAGEGGTAIADRPTLRGLNSSASVFVDGIRDIGTQTRDVFALDAVEVLKGADSVYAGRGSGGGSVNLVSKRAKTEDATRATLMLGSSSTLRGSIDQNWSVTDSTALRLNVMGNTGGIPGRDDAVDYEKWGVAGNLAFGLGSPTRVHLDYYHLSDSGMPDYSIPYDLATGLPVTETLGVDRENFYGLLNRDFRDAETDIGTLSLARDLDHGMTLSNVTRLGRSTNAYVVTNPDDSKGNVAHGYVNRISKNRWSQTDTFANVTDLSATVATAGLQHALHFGLEYSREKKQQDGYTVTSANPPTSAGDCANAAADVYDCTSLYAPNPSDPWLGSVTRNRTPTFYTTEVTGIYAFDTITLHPQWQANIGLRWDHYQTSTEKPSAPTANGASADYFVNYQAGVVYKPVEQASLYLSYSTETTPAQLGSGDEDAANPGSPSGCTSRCSVSNLNLDPEETRSVELGAKWEVLDQRLLLTAALFDSVRQNANILISADTYAQAGKARVRGAELSFTGQLLPAWQVFGGYSYLDSELVRGTFGSAAVGKELPNTPKNSFSLSTRYQLLDRLSIGGGGYYVSQVYGNTAGTAAAPAKRVPSYWRFDASAGYELSHNFNLRLNVQNLTDELYYTKAYASHYAALGTGRQLLVSVDMTF